MEPSTKEHAEVHPALSSWEYCNKGASSIAALDKAVAEWRSVAASPHVLPSEGGSAWHSFPFPYPKWGGVFPLHLFFLPWWKGQMKIYSLKYWKWHFNSWKPKCGRLQLARPLEHASLSPSPKRSAHTHRFSFADFHTATWLWLCSHNNV